MAQIDMGLLLLVVIAVVAVIGLILALQTAGGRRRLADGGLRLAEALIALAVRWLERDAPPASVTGAIAQAEEWQGNLDRARAAQAALRQ